MNLYEACKESLDFLRLCEDKCYIRTGNCTHCYKISVIKQAMAEYRETLAQLEAGLLQKSIFKQYIAEKPHGQCQITFPLTDLDGICEKIVSLTNY